MQQRISIIGSGRVASHFARAWADKGVLISQIYSPSERAKILADQVAAQRASSILDIAPVDVLLLAVADQHIAAVAEQLAQAGYSGLVVHSSGSTDISVLTQYGLRAGVLYPLQSFSHQQPVPWMDTPLFLEATQQRDLNRLQAIAALLSDKIYNYDSKQRLSLHLAAVFACNFSNYCVDIAQQLLLAQQVEPNLLLPLIAHTMHKLQQQSAFSNQTGPAQRQDHSTLAQHMQQLQAHPQWAAIYQLLSTAIQQRHQA